MRTAIDASLLPASRSSLDHAFGFDAARMRGRGLAFLALALALHGGLALAVRVAPPCAPEMINVTEVELPPPAPEPEKATVPEEQHAEPIAKPSALPPPPQAARAGALITAKESAPSAKKDELVDFVTDPAGTSYGSGVVARGGTADRGERGATAAGAGSAPVRTVAGSPSDVLVPAANLSRRAALNERDACAGFYPSEADADSGAVTLTVVVRADGGVSSASVVSESPAGQGFGKAARACIQRKRFEPSLDQSGTAVAAATTIKLRFVR